MITSVIDAPEIRALADELINKHYLVDIVNSYDFD